MSIITFGSTVQQKVQQSSGHPTMTEELIDEQLKARLEKAWRCQQDKNLTAAMEIYLDILKSATLAESVIEKHLQMQNQCHRNLGDVFEQLQAYEHAKHHYTQALKLDSANSVAWTRLGFINYEHLGNLALAKKCFQAATKTMPTLDKIGQKICPVLVKLAEIAFLEADYRESQRICDAILTRQVSDRQTQLFVLLMKHYFWCLGGQNPEQSEWLYRAHQIDPNARVGGLTLFQKLKARANKATILMTKDGDFTCIDFDDRQKVKLSVVPCQDFPAFLKSLLSSILELSDPEKFKNGEFVYDTSEFIQQLEASLPLFRKNWAKQQRQESAESLPQVQQPPTAQAEKRVEKNQKILRKKPDNLEQMLRTIKLARFQPYRELVYNQLAGDDAMSAKEIQAFIGLMTKGSGGAVHLHSSDTLHTLTVKAEDAVMSRFLEVLKKIDCFSCCLYVRNLLKLCCDTQLVTADNAPLIFKLFLMKPDSLATLSSSVLLVLFELSLFSKPVMKETKPGPIVLLRSQFYDYCLANTGRIMDSLPDELQKFRFLHAMMYTAFEIKQDMQKSVQFYQRLDLSILSNREIELPWVSESYSISLAQVTQFGSQKIKEAQLVNKQNQALREMKQREYESTKTASYVRQECSPDIVYFYLERFYLHLKNLLQSNETALNDERLKEIWDQQLMFCLARVKTGFWQIVHHLFCVLSAFKSLAYKGYCQTTIFETIVLRRIDFEPLIQEIVERSKPLTSRLTSGSHLDTDALQMCLQQENVTMQLLSKIQIHVVRMLSPEFVLFNVKQGGSSCNIQDPGQPFLSAYLRCLFQLELLRGFSANSFAGVTLLIKSLDGVAQEMSELMMRAYSKLFQFSLAPLFRLWACGCHEKELQVLLEKSLSYLFKFQVDDLEDEAQDVVMEEEEMTELSLFDGMQFSKSEKPKFALPTPQQIFSAVSIVNKETDTVLLADVVMFADQMAGRRLIASCGAFLTAKDVKNCAKLVESIVRVLQMDKLYREVQSASAIENYKFSQEPFAILASQEETTPLQTVVQFVFNVFGSLALPQHSTSVVMAPTRRFQLIEKLLQLKDMQKIKNLSRMPVYSGCVTVDSALICSTVDMQLYMQAAQAKLLCEPGAAYTANKSFKVSALNAAVFALDQSCKKNDLHSCLRALHQLLNITYCRIVYKRKTKSEKMQNLVCTGFYLAKVCELVECLLVQPTKRDPRMQGSTQEELLSVARSIIQTTLAEIQKSYSQFTVNNSLLPNVSESIQNLIVLALDIEKHQRLVPYSLLNADYPMIQTIMQRLTSADNIGVQELKQSCKAFEFATASKDNLVALEAAYDLIGSQLKVLIDHKYSQTQASQTVLEIIEGVTRGFLNEAETFAAKFTTSGQPENNQDIIDEDEVLFDQKASHLIRGRLQVPTLQSVDTSVDGFIHRLYKVADTIVTKLQAQPTLLQYQWFLVKYKYMLQGSLLQEARHLPREKLRLLLDPADALSKELMDLEEATSMQIDAVGNQPVFCQQQMQIVFGSVLERPTKSLLSIYFSTSILRSAVSTRTEIKRQLVWLWENTCEYEQLQQLFKKAQDSYRKSMEKQTDQLEIFMITKKALIQTINAHADTLFQTYLRLRSQLQDFDAGKAQKKGGYTECRQLLKELRVKYELTPTNYPSILKDAFELFNETHSSRAFLKRSGHVTEAERHTVRLALLKASALCGPDEANEPGAGKFIELGQSSNEYSFEALQVAIKWYVNFLDLHKKSKKDQDLAKKLQQTVDEIKADLNQVQSQELPFGAIASQVARKQEVLAQKVFSQPKKQ